MASGGATLTGTEHAAGFAGTVKCSFYKEPAWVDVTKKPGWSFQFKDGVGYSWIPNIIFMDIFFSPNFIWMAIALADYLVFPLDLEAAKTWAFGWVFKRIAINLGIMFAYYGWWWVTLYVLRWSKRKFNPHLETKARFFHNVWYSMLGAVQWAMLEVLFMRLYATDAVQYIPDTEAFATWPNIARMVGWTIFVPFWRNIHFYFAHRVIHTRFFYKYVHVLHHRNNDTEPFAGLCMHPIEHMYYYSCAGASLFFLMSPWHMLWFGIHALISPAASHSGWEDNWQSDQFHYLHHSHYECNYGTAGLNLDYFFGTARGSFDPQDAMYKGEGYDPTQAPLMDSQGSDGPPPTVPDAIFGEGEMRICDAFPNMRVPKQRDEAIYMLFTALMFAATLYTLINGSPYDDKTTGIALGLFVSVGPFVFAALLFLVTKDPWKKQHGCCGFFWPFHKEPSRLSLHFVVGGIFVILPVYALVAAQYGQGFPILF